MKAAILVFLAAAVNASTLAASLHEQHQHPVVEWLQTREGGFFRDDKITFHDGGMFATDSISRGEVLLVVPPSALLYDHDKEDETTSNADDKLCATVRKLVREYHKHEEPSSDFAPYVKYVFEEFAHQELPMAWSEPAKELVQTFVGEALQPLDFGLDDENTYQEACPQDGDYGSYDDKFQRDLDAALRIVVSRGWNHVLCPVFDMFNHRNGQWQNIDRSPEDGADLSVTGNYTIVALRDIDAGEQLHNSYNDCHDVTCFGIGLTYTTPHIFNDYGFVEQYPTRWRFDNIENLRGLTWQVDRNQQTGSLTVEWLTNPALDQTDRDEAMEEFWRYLIDNEGEIEESVKSLPHEYEQRAILEYYQALTTAFEQAWIHAADGKQMSISQCGDSREQECATPLSMRLDNAPGSDDLLDVDDLNHQVGACKIDRDDQNSRCGRLHVVHQLKVLRKEIQKADDLEDPLESLVGGEYGRYTLGHSEDGDHVLVSVPWNATSQDDKESVSAAPPQPPLRLSWFKTFQSVMPTHLFQDMLALFLENMGEMYKQSSWGLDMDGKKEQLEHHRARYLVVTTEANDDEQQQQLAAFLHYRFEYNDDEDPTSAALYIYEIQVSSTFQSKGIGRFLMQLVDRIAQQACVSKTMLTVFQFNHRAKAFYRKLQYVVDEISPSKHGEKEDYEIMSKAVDKVAKHC